MPRRIQQDCPLCPPHLDSAQHDEVYYAYQKTREFEAPAEKARSFGVEATEEDARAHFQYHKIIQPPPLGNLRRSHALKEGQGLPDRLQNVITLISRVNSLSATQIAELFYWQGNDAQMSSARNACYRDLRRLILDDFVYRYYPPSTAKPTGTRTRGRQDQLSLYFLGRDAVPFIEEEEDIVIPRREWISSTEQLSDESRILQAHEASEIVGAFNRQIKIFASQDKRPLVEGVPPMQVSFNPLNWYGPSRSRIEFRDPLSGIEEQVSPTGFAALGLKVPERDFSVLAPFFYEYDAGVKPLATYAQELLGYYHLSRSGALSDVFTQLPRRDYFPPILVVCRDISRVIALQEEVGRLMNLQNLGDTMPAVVVTDSVTQLHHGFAGQSWLSLWDRSLDGRRYRLLEVLLRSCRPLIGTLSADDIINSKNQK
jgi:hypothetical protein